MSGDRDLLERAARALREATPPSADELLAARARLLAAHHATGQSRRGSTLRWVLPLAAVLAAGTALAATPEAMERVARAVTSLFTPHTVDFAAKKKRAPAKPQEQASSASPAAQPKAAERLEPTPTAEPSQNPQSVPPTAASTPSASASRQAPSRSTRASRRQQHALSDAAKSERAAPTATAEAADTAPVVESAPAPELAPDLDLALYRVAHNAHFRSRDFVAALRGWNAYLNAYPRGTFAVEARYNRAICLVRLDQKDEARRALSPFAKGEVAHGYRQAEAKKLLEALE